MEFDIRDLIFKIGRFLFVPVFFFFFERKIEMTFKEGEFNLPKRELNSIVEKKRVKVSL